MELLAKTLLFVITTVGFPFIMWSVLVRILSNAFDGYPTNLAVTAPLPTHDEVLSSRFAFGPAVVTATLWISKIVFMYGNKQLDLVTIVLASIIVSLFTLITSKRIFHIKRYETALIFTLIFVDFPTLMLLLALRMQ